MNSNFYSLSGSLPTISSAPISICIADTPDVRRRVRRSLASAGFVVVYAALGFLAAVAVFGCGEMAEWCLGWSEGSGAWVGLWVRFHLAATVDLEVSHYSDRFIWQKK